MTSMAKFENKAPLHEYFVFGIYNNEFFIEVMITYIFTISKFLYF